MNYDLLKEGVWQMFVSAQAVLIIWLIFKVTKMDEQIEKVKPFKNTYKKKTEFVEVLKYEGVPIGEAIRFCDNKAHMDVNAHLYIHTLEGNIRVRVGDYIIKDEQGKISLCKPDVFEQNFSL